MLSSETESGDLGSLTKYFTIGNADLLILSNKMKLFVEDRIVMLVQRTVMDVCSNFEFMWQYPVQGWSGRVALK